MGKCSLGLPSLNKDFIIIIIIIIISEIYQTVLNSFKNLIKKIASSDILFIVIYTRKIVIIRFNIIMITVLLEYRLRLWLWLQVIIFFSITIIINHDYMISKNMFTIMIMITI